MKNILIKLSLFLAVSLASCEDNFLDKKPNKSIVIPSTLSDLQALLDNAQVMNTVPALGLNGTDDLFTTDDGFNFLSLAVERNSYRWATDFYQGEIFCTDWNVPYQQVFYANVVLEGLESIKTTPTNEKQWQEIKGSALFFRAHAFYQLAQLFAPHYSEQSGLVGIPLRLTADINAPVFRASLQETYNQIITDLEQANDLLPQTSQYKTRPTKIANKAMLARVYLTMANYTQAEIYASEVLNETDYLLNFNNLSPSATRPIPRMNDEILFYATLITYRFTTSSFTFADTTLIESYQAGDLRRRIFFRQRGANRYTFKGNYTGNAILFGGITNSEVYLIRSECRFRNGNTDGALEDLNTLLSNRWTTASFIPIEETNPDVLLTTILSERQKELVFRGTRWSDLRRLNTDPAFAKTISRRIQEMDYILLPNDQRYVLPIPPQEILASNIQQNPR